MSQKSCVPCAGTINQYFTDMNDKKITKIEIWSRGKNRDVYGNPYFAWIAKIRFCNVSYFRCVTIHMGMMAGDSSEQDCLMWACQGINEALGTDIRMNDERIVHHYQHTSRDTDLLDPTKWRI